jgi:CheY-like chemotaxis protein
MDIKPLVLIVEDEDLMRAILTRLLEEAGYRVATANSAVTRTLARFMSFLHQARPGGSSRPAAMLVQCGLCIQLARGFRRPVAGMHLERDTCLNKPPLRSARRSTLTAPRRLA